MTCRCWIPKIPFPFYSVLWCWYWSQQACDWNVHRWHVLVYLGADGTSLWMPGCGSVSREENTVLTSSPGFSPTFPTSLVPWGRGWTHNQCFLYPRTDVQVAKAHPFNTPPLPPPPRPLSLNQKRCFGCCSKPLWGKSRFKADTHEGFCSRSILQGHAPGAKLLPVYQWFHGYTSSSGAEFPPRKMLHNI